MIPGTKELGMFTTGLDRVVEVLRAEHARRCCYGTTDGDGRPCDCKYGWTPEDDKKQYLTERTGCPELRQAIRTLEWMNGQERAASTAGNS